MRKKIKDYCRYCGADPKRDCDGHKGGGCEYHKYQKKKRKRNR